MLTLKIIIASTRPGRKGPIIARWFAEEARKHGIFKIETLDLADFNLPLLDEAAHPALQQYTKDHTKKWSAAINAADAYVVITPEYDFTMPASLLNAFQVLYREWNYKPMGFVSYGGISGGLRSVQTAKLAATTLKVMPMYEAVTVPNFETFIEGEIFKASEQHVKSAKTMLHELNKWAVALKTMRP